MVLSPPGFSKLSLSRVCDAVSGDAGDLAHAVVDDLAVLDVLAADLGELACVGAVVGNELRDDGELGLGIDGLARAIEGVALTVAADIASVLVAHVLVAVVPIAAVGPGALYEAVPTADVGCVGCGD